MSYPQKYKDVLSCDFIPEKRIDDQANRARIGLDHTIRLAHPRHGYTEGPREIFDPLVEIKFFYRVLVRS
jgi:hypothetical protein